MGQNHSNTNVYEVSYYGDFGREIYYPATSDMASAESAWRRAKLQGIETARISQVSVPALETQSTKSVLPSAA